MSKLYIIGNGFDLKHGIPSRYSDFAKFVKSIDLNFFLKMERFYPNLSIDDLWSNFEEALGMPDYKELINDYELLVKSGYADKDGNLGVKLCELKELFGKWVFSLVEHISNSFFEKKYVFDAESLYISFNYTRTLEIIYKIKSPNICYIHDCAPKDKESRKCFIGYVFGHGNVSLDSDMQGINDFNLREKLKLTQKELYKEPQWDS